MPGSQDTGPGWTTGAIAGQALLALSGARTASLFTRGGASAVTSAATSELTLTHGLTLSRHAMKALVNDIAENGIRDPIKYVEVNGNKFVVDGHHRLAAARQLGIKDVPVQQVQLPYAGYRSVGDLEFRIW
jgi:hypothetical protein